MERWDGEEREIVLVSISQKLPARLVSAVACPLSSDGLLGFQVSQNDISGGQGQVIK